MRASSIEEILHYCEEFFPGEPPEYFFDRNPDNFPQILDMYRSVRLGLNLIERQNFPDREHLSLFSFLFQGLFHMSEGGAHILQEQQPILLFLLLEYVVWF